MLDSRKINSEDKEQLKSICEKDFTLSTNAGEAPVRYCIDMENDYLSISGKITKKQHLEAVYTRKLDTVLSSISAVFKYIWEEARFTSKSLDNKVGPIDLSFAEEREFKYIRVLNNTGFSSDDYDQVSEGNKERIDIDYSDLASTPMVNLLYLLSWDVVTFEEFINNLCFVSEKVKRPGSTTEFDMISGSDIRIPFGGCSQETSVFRNGSVYVSLTGYSLIGDESTAVYDYMSRGSINVQDMQEINPTKQKGESYFFGKLCVGMDTSELLLGDMVEIITGSVKRDERVIPVHKRRVVKIEMLR